MKWYNNIHLHGGINFIIPSQRYYVLEKSIINNRIKVYEKSKVGHPVIIPFV